jgi:uncharacterized protein YndB with AHSA1/START domain
MTEAETAASDNRTLKLQRTLNAPREKLYRCWTEPKLMKRWFTPAPWKTVEVEVDLRPGGSSKIIMESPEGQQFPNRGVYLQVVPNELLVFTDAYTRAWEPAEKPFFTCEVHFEDAGDGRTKYTAIARHWTEADRKAHEEMGFHEGWGKVAEQLEAVAQSL